ncbi:MAG: response regulator [Roseibium sp.]|uniref:response regulator n=2 Tax=Roseibium sp. TaxID=1936156 RepID=UPI001B074096|nr:response regulator [Roseibium sp.]MBO6510910.1 response regulator [Roseibium sp.]MBO6893973.1 response regulator [Roseibium sp.]MBO6932260.1 response regulator [Roseibium sp.]
MNTSPSPQQILVCDDEPHLREMVAEYLTERGYCVSEAENANVMNDLLEKTQPALIILDVNMPGTDGLTALRNLRTTSTVPVIMLTAASEVVDRIVGLEMGADDYVGKPVDLRELEARIKAALRRQSFVETESEQRDRLNGTVPFGPCRLDIDGAKLFGVDGNEIAITAMEFSLLRVFAENRGRVLNRDQLLEQAHDKGWEPFDRSIDLRISRLRRKIEPNPTKPETIRTVRGIGYVFG